MSDTARTIEKDGISLATESFGTPGDPAILLVMGATASMLWWPEALCHALAAHGRFVIRYDHRDTGASTGFPLGEAGYALDDLVADAVRVLDGYGVDRAHWVGMSLGGIIGQIAALAYPDRVAALTMIGSGPLDADDPDLPGIAPEFLEFFATAGDLNWEDAHAVAAFVATQHEMCARRPGTDRAELERRALTEYRRAENPASRFNHATLTVDEQWKGRLGEITAPALVIHGTLDPINPFPLGEMLADVIPEAKLHALEGAGHELSPQDIAEIADAIYNVAPR